MSSTKEHVSNNNKLALIVNVMKKATWIHHSTNSTYIHTYVYALFV